MVIDGRVKTADKDSTHVESSMKVIEAIVECMESFNQSVISSATVFIQEITSYNFYSPSMLHKFEV